MLRNIIGDWGAGLSDDDYARALAALGVLEATGTERHRATSDPLQLLAAFRKEFQNGEQTVMWRGAKNAGRATTVASWRETVHTDAAALADAWSRYFAEFAHPRQHPRLAVKLDWCDRADLFDFTALGAWLARSGVQALVLDDGRAGRARPRWHWPLQVGVPAGADGAGLLTALGEAQRGRSWVAELARCFTVGQAHDACDLLLLTPGDVGRLLEQARSRIRASFVVCLDETAPDLAPFAERSIALRERLDAAGVAAMSRSSASFSLVDWFVAVLREVSHDLPIHAAIWGTAHHRFGVDPLIFGDPAALDRCRILAIAERQDRVAAALEAAAEGNQFAAHRPPHLGIDDELTFGGPATTPPAPVPARAPAARRPARRQTQAQPQPSFRRIRCVAERAIHEFADGIGKGDVRFGPRARELCRNAGQAAVAECFGGVGQRAQGACVRCLAGLRKCTLNARPDAARSRIIAARGEILSEQAEQALR